MCHGTQDWAVKEVGVMKPHTRAAEVEPARKKHDFWAAKFKFLCSYGSLQIQFPIYRWHTTLSSLFSVSQMSCFLFNIFMFLFWTW